MIPINIYVLTRLDDTYNQERLERQLSSRSRFLKVKDWEIKGLKTLSERLHDVMDNATSLKFFYSFTMPKLGKEFDLLRISNDSVVNIELKSGIVSDEVIKRQLQQNRYYLSTLDRTMYSYTYISEADRLVRLTGGGRIIDSTWEDLADVLNKQQDCYEGHIEELFREDRYLISPLTDPLRFLRGDYFLTAQQRDIRNSILKDVLDKPGVIKKEVSVHGFTGLPGTGKTLSTDSKVCVLHFGSHEKELEHLDERLKRVDFYYCDNHSGIGLREDYSAILVDEGHRLNADNLKDILDTADGLKAPVIISYDREDSIAYEERNHDGSELIESLADFHGYKLTNRIRLNSELSAFIAKLMFIGSNHRKEFPSVSVAYSSDDSETAILVSDYIKQGYVYIYDEEINTSAATLDGCMEVSEATCREFDRVVMVINDLFAYDNNGYLRSVHDDRPVVRDLFHGLSRAKDKIAVIVQDNEDVLNGILTILQGDINKQKRG